MSICIKNRKTNFIVDKYSTRYLNLNKKLYIFNLTILKYRPSEYKRIKYIYLINFFFLPNIYHYIQTLQKHHRFDIHARKVDYKHGSSQWRWLDIVAPDRIIWSSSCILNHIHVINWKVINSGIWGKCAIRGKSATKHFSLKVPPTSIQFNHTLLKVNCWLDISFIHCPEKACPHHMPIKNHRSPKTTPENESNKNDYHAIASGSVHSLRVATTTARTNADVALNAHPTSTISTHTEDAWSHVIFTCSSMRSWTAWRSDLD